MIHAFRIVGSVERFKIRNFILDQLRLQFQFCVLQHFLQWNASTALFVMMLWNVNIPDNFAIYTGEQNRTNVSKF